MLLGCSSATGTFMNAVYQIGPKPSCSEHLMGKWSYGPGRLLSNGCPRGGTTESGPGQLCKEGWGVLKKGVARAHFFLTAMTSVRCLKGLTGIYVADFSACPTSSKIRLQRWSQWD